MGLAEGIEMMRLKEPQDCEDRKAYTAVDVFK